MALKRIVNIVVAVQVLVIAGLVAYHHYVDGKTPTSAAFQAFEEYNDLWEWLLSPVGSAIAKRVPDEAL